MGLRIISFTEQGLQLAQKIAQTCACDMGSEDIAVVAKCSYIQSTESFFPVEFVEEAYRGMDKKADAGTSYPAVYRRMWNRSQGSCTMYNG